MRENSIPESPFGFHYSELRIQLPVFNRWLNEGHNRQEKGASLHSHRLPTGDDQAPSERDKAVVVCVVKDTSQQRDPAMITARWKAMDGLMLELELLSA